LFINIFIGEFDCGGLQQLQALFQTSDTVANTTVDSCRVVLTSNWGDLKIFWKYFNVNHSFFFCWQQERNLY